MPIVIGISFKKAGKVYHFGTNGLDVKEGMHVITETARGWKLGFVVSDPKEIDENEIIGTLKDIDRIANEADLQRAVTHKKREEEALLICEEKIAEHNLPMKLLDAELSFDESVITFSFSAEGRVDFRELVKSVAGALKLKVQLLQIGVRDEAKLVGGYGSCGRQLCCSLFLTNFEPISMKMAKDQSLFLNPAKFSGCCGKLMCCLRYEHEYYNDVQNTLPPVGTIIETENGPARIQDYNVIAHTVILQNEERVTFTLPIAKAGFVGLCKKHGCQCDKCEGNCTKITSEELENLGVLNIPSKIEEEEVVISLPSYGEKNIAFDFPEEILEDEDIPVRVPSNSKRNNDKRKQKQSNGFKPNLKIGDKLPSELATSNLSKTIDKKENGDDNSSKIKQNTKGKAIPKPFKMESKNPKNQDLGITFREVKEEAPKSAPKKPHSNRPHYKHKGAKGK